MPADIAKNMRAKCKLNGGKILKRSENIKTNKMVKILILNRALNS
jgi:hypothetical protein